MASSSRRPTSFSCGHQIVGSVLPIWATAGAAQIVLPDRRVEVGERDRGVDRTERGEALAHRAVALVDRRRRHAMALGDEVLRELKELRARTRDGEFVVQEQEMHRANGP
ncbi:MAG TPA: hypothetical protein VJY39_18730 [Acidisphaera sp.]|nr:hypothetical protein [Acidisphaera sp.]